MFIVFCLENYGEVGCDGITGRYEDLETAKEKGIKNLSAIQDYVEILDTSKMAVTRWQRDEKWTEFEPLKLKD